MKIGNPPNYYVQVFPDAWGEPPETAALYQGCYTVKLNITVSVHFVPDVSEAGPPWRLELLPADEEEFTTAAQVRLYEVTTSTYSVTPNPALAGRAEQTARPDSPSTVFYVTPDHFAGYVANLSALAEVASDSIPSIRRDDVLDIAVIRFIDEHVLASPLLLPIHADALGRRPRMTGLRTGIDPQR